MPEMIVSGTELRTLIEDAMRFRDEKTNGQFKVIDTKLDGITQRLDKINGTVARHEKSLNDEAIIIANYLEQTFTWLSQAKDGSTGYPGDGQRLQSPETYDGQRIQQYRALLF